MCLNLRKNAIRKLPPKVWGMQGFESMARVAILTVAGCFLRRLSFAGAVRGAMDAPHIRCSRNEVIELAAVHV